MQRSVLVVLILSAVLLFPTLFAMFKTKSAAVPESFQYDMPIAQGFNGSLFSGERQLGDQMAWRSRKSKCYSCEADMARRFGPAAGYYGQAQSCFSCSAPYPLK